MNNILQSNWTSIVFVF